MKATTVEKISNSIKEALKKTNDAISFDPNRFNRSNLEKLIWEIRSKVEYSIILLNINIENATSDGLRSKTNNLKNIPESLKIISVILKEAWNDLNSKNYSIALKNLRNARAILDKLLNQIKKEFSKNPII